MKLRFWIRLFVGTKINWYRFSHSYSFFVIICRTVNVLNFLLMQRKN